MSSNDLTNPTHGEVGILIGGDAASLQLFDHLQLNSLRKPLNLRFFSSEVMEKSITYGEVGGDWYPENEISIDIEKPVEKKKEVFSYNTSIYNLLKEQDDNKIKEKDNWSEDEEVMGEDDWSDFPNWKDATKYKLASYCPMRWMCLQYISQMKMMITVCLKKKSKH